MKSIIASQFGTEVSERFHHKSLIRRITNSISYWRNPTLSQYNKEKNALSYEKYR